MLSIKFLDGELINSHGLKNVPNKPIQKIKLHLDTKTILLENYEEYNYLFERAYQPFQGNQFVKAIWIMGKNKEIVEGYIINLQQKTLQKFTAPNGKEFKGLPTTGWKQGILNQIPNRQII